MHRRACMAAFITPSSVSYDGVPPKLVYTCEEANLEESVLQKFVQVCRDEETTAYLERYCSGKESFWRSTVAHVTNYFLSRTDSNALVGRGQMFVLSTQQLRILLAFGNGGIKANTAQERSVGQPFDRLLDIGAGDGTVTEKFSPLVSHITATEVSSYMAKRLRERPFVDEVHECDNLDNIASEFDMMCLLNVLDRCNEPSTLLHAMKERLVPVKGRLILAVVLPFCPFVEDGTKQKKPDQDLDMDGGRCKQGATFEASVNTLINKVLIPHGFNIHAWTRVPYLCAGDDRQQYYVLSDAIFVLSHDGGEQLERPVCLSEVD